MKYTRIILLSFSLVTLFACEDKIDLDLDEGRSQLVVDGFLSSDSTIQTIRLTKSAAYFANVPTPDENNANVRVVGPNNTVYPFVTDNNGNFNYDPITLGRLDSIGFPYKLELDYNGATYTSVSVLNPVPIIDSMTYDFEEEEVGSEEGYYTQFYARDFAGRKDYYWVKAYRNGVNVYEEDRSFIILSEDAAFGGDGADGFVFILPIRASITDEENPFVIGDTSSVELLSLNLSSYEFLEQLGIQSQNGGLFSTPPANVRTNILDANGNPQEEVIGVFSLSSISKAQIVIR